ncbi:MAG: TonB-dependent receptor, partial [Halioglobus sp.]|nr:TonB-dependent receptor [Halioglobus sp.]
WNDSEYKKFLSVDANACQSGPLREGRSLDPLCTEEQDLEGNQFPTMPEHKVSANLTFMWNIAELDWTLTTSYLYTDESWADAFNNPELDKIESYDVWNLRLAVSDADRVWRAEAFVRNLEDDREITGRGRPSTVTGNAQVDLQNPRVMGVNLEYNF